MKINLEKQLKQLDENIAAWSKRGDESFKKRDQNMTLACYSDVGQLKLVKFYTQQGYYAVAYAIAYWLDTIVRDQVPTELYTYLEGFDQLVQHVTGR